MPRSRSFNTYGLEKRTLLTQVVKAKPVVASTDPFEDALTAALAIEPKPSKAVRHVRIIPSK